MRIYIAGKYGPFPGKHGAASGFLVDAGAGIYGLDMGAGVFARISAEIPAQELKALFLTHWHFDHMSDLGVLRYALEQALRKKKLDRPLPVYVPDAEDAALAPYRSEAFDFLTMPRALALGEYTLRRFENQHPAPCYGLRWGDDLYYSSDTRAYPALKAQCEGVRLMLMDSCIQDAGWSEAMPHMSIAQGARIAREAGVGKLLLVHLNPELPAEAVLAEARAEYPDAELAAEGAWYSV